MTSREFCIQKAVALNTSLSESEQNLASQSQTLNSRIDGLTAERDMSADQLRTIQFELQTAVKANLDLSNEVKSTEQKFRVSIEHQTIKSFFSVFNAIFLTGDTSTA
jgi:hypothetical protein